MAIDFLWHCLEFMSDCFSFEFIFINAFIKMQRDSFLSLIYGSIPNLSSNGLLIDACLLHLQFGRDWFLSTEASSLRTSILEHLCRLFKQEYSILEQANNPVIPLDGEATCKYCHPHQLQWAPHICLWHHIGCSECCRLYLN